MNLGGFSWKRFVGISQLKSNISRSIGIPLTESGRMQKIGRMLTGGGLLGGILAAITAEAVEYAITAPDAVPDSPPDFLADSATIRCPGCGLENWHGAMICKKCFRPVG